MVGAALALDREGVWGLSLLVVLPEYQSRGVGRALLERSLEYAGGGERGAIILASPDSRALRAYARAGFEAHPCFDASGHPRSASRRASVREGDERDIPFTEAVDRAVRGAAHGSDIAAFMRAHRRLFVIDDRGYAVLGGNGVNLLAALDEEAAARPAARGARGGAHGPGGPRRVDHRRTAVGGPGRCSTRGSR